jgi:uncharacterized membrane protein
MCGPIALVLSIIALMKLEKIEHRFDDKGNLPVRKKIVKPAQPLKAAVSEMVVSKIPDDQKTISKPAIISEDVIAKPSSMLLEQKIGTMWIPIAGIISLIFAAGFFLKYAYDNFILSPEMRMVGVAVCGVVAIIAGEITRRREYDIVAKSVTALGFGLLYAAVFAGYGMYDLLGTWPALLISVTITAVAMAWAVRLDEVVIAFLSLLGGFLTPIIIASDQNLALPLFMYLAVLGSGAIICASYRKWRAINFLAFAGTYISYTLWIINSYRPDAIESQRQVALLGLLIFFAIYFIMPILYEMIHAVKTKKEDVLLILSNASVTLALLFYLLHHDRSALGVVAVALAGVHFAMMAVSRWRCSQDRDLRIVLQGIGLFMITVSIPQFAGIYTLSLIWAGEGIILAIIGLRYRSTLTQIAGSIALILGCTNLMIHLPIHTDHFRLVFNEPFGAWCFVAIAAYICHLIYRPASEKTNDVYSRVAQWIFTLCSVLLMGVFCMELYAHFRENLQIDAPGLLLSGIAVIIAAITLLLTARPVCPKGAICRTAAVITAIGGAIIIVIALSVFRENAFMIFLNSSFLVACVFTVSLAAAGRMVRQGGKDTPQTRNMASILIVTSVTLLWIALTEDIYMYWYCINEYEVNTANWSVLAHMWISIMWAIYAVVLMVVGFWRRFRKVRYASLALFAILLAKVFLVDTSQMESIYRVSAFVVTGLTLVGVSYLYQYLKKKGFFEVLEA